MRAGLHLRRAIDRDVPNSGASRKPCAGFPNQVGALCFGKYPVLRWRDLRESEKFRFEIMISQQFVDAPETELAQSRRKQMRVDINKRRRGEDIFHHRVHFIYGD